MFSSAGQNPLVVNHMSPPPADWDHCCFVSAAFIYYVVGLLLDFVGDITVCDCHLCLGELFFFNLFIFDDSPSSPLALSLPVGLSP